MTLGRPPDRWAEMLAALDADADVAVRIDDGAGRQTHGRLTAGPDPTAGGRVVRLVVDRPEVAAAALPAGSWRHGRAWIAGLDRLAGSGWRAELRGPRGLLAAVDPDRPRRLSRWVSGSSSVHVTPAAVRAAAPGATRVAVVAALLGVALLAGRAARRRRR